jgi:lysozyme
MQTSRKGALFIAQREALVLEAYQDGRHLSIGFGWNSQHLRPGDKTTVQESFKRLREDIALREPAVNKALKVDVAQHQFDALMSLYYQGGSDGLDAVVAHVNREDWQEAAREFLEWDTNAAGARMEGLLKRRGLEVGMFLAAEYGDLRHVKLWRKDPRKTKPRLYRVKPGDI